MKSKFLKLFVVFLYVSIAGLLSWFSNYRSVKGIDDANIYFVYMRNLANGNGFVFNIGGERVEGFTSLLWTLIGGVVFKFFSQPEPVLIIISVLLVSYSLWRILLFLDYSNKEDIRFSASSILLLGLLLVVPGYFDWTVTSIMETGLWSCLLILISLNILTSDYPNGETKNTEFNLLLILLLICRPESILWCLFFIFMKFIKPLVEKKSSILKSAKVMAPSLIIYIVGLSILTGWRLAYFGYPVPNTFYAKVSSDRVENIFDGIVYLFEALSNNVMLTFALVFSPLIVYEIYIHQKKIPFSILFGFGILLVTLFIPLFTGGDHFAYSRFIQPTMPLVLLYVLMIFKYFKVKLRNPVIISFILFASFLPERTIYANLQSQNSALNHEYKIAVLGRKNSEALNTFFANTAALPSQGVATAGGQAYSYKGSTIDLLGLNNVEMAHRSSLESQGVKNHSSFNKEVFFEQKPNLFWYAGNIVDKRNVPHFNTLVINDFYRQVFNNIHEDQLFKKDYSAVLISNRNLDYSLAIFASNNYLKELEKTAFYEYKTIQIR